MTPNTFDDETTWAPDYAPGLARSGKRLYWRAPARYVKAGWDKATVRINDPEDCRPLTRELLRWWRRQGESATDFGTWAYVIRRYLTDEFSPFQDVKGNTQANYASLLDRWDGIIGHVRLADTDYTLIRRLEKSMRDEGRTTSSIKRMFTMLRGATRYAATALDMRDARRISDVLSAMRFKSAPHRAVAPTRAQVEAIARVAAQAGSQGFAAGLLIAWWLNLRLNDVFGDFIDGTWQDGLTWGMLSRDCTTMTKVISKTKGTLAEPYTFDLTLVPEIPAMLLAMRPELAVGPVILTAKGQPFTRSGRAQAWRRYRKAAGVPPEVQMRDIRAGGLTEAKGLGATPYDLRDAAQHTQLSTTDRYGRARSDAANKVVKLRRGGCITIMKGKANG